jgi:predicted metal-binding membrane protein
MAEPPSPLERVLRHDRAIVLAALIAVSVLPWLWMIDMAHAPLAAAQLGLMSCCGVSLPMTFVMWAVMMVGMMVPSAAPMVLAFAETSRRRAEAGTPFAPAATFVAGYLAIWTGFSLLAAIAQWALFHVGLLDPHRQTTVPWLAGSLLIAAGLFQLTPLKNACLASCRSPIGFLVSEWRDGGTGAAIMGFKHGLHCVGCCWLLMAMLFVAGVMNLWWVALISIYVLLEKTLRSPRRVMIGAAAACLIAGALLLAEAAVRIG